MNASANPNLSPAWEIAKAAYLAARRVELAFDAEHIMPTTANLKAPSLAMNAAVQQIPRRTWEESERLMALRSDAEDVLMAIPSPDATAFAFKVLIARADGRETDRWDAMLVDEARRIVPDFLFYREALPVEAAA